MVLAVFSLSAHPRAGCPALPTPLKKTLAGGILPELFSRLLLDLCLLFLQLRFLFFLLGFLFCELGLLPLVFGLALLLLGPLSGLMARRHTTQNSKAYANKRDGERTEKLNHLPAAGAPGRSLLLHYL